MNTSTIKISNTNFFQKDLQAYSLLRKKMFHPKSDMQINGDTLISLRHLYATISTKKISEYIQPFFNGRITSIKHLNIKSTFHTLFLITVDSRKYVLKLNPLQDRYRDFSFFVEKIIQKKLQENNLPHVVSYADVSRKTIPYDFLLMDYINGENMENYAGKNTEELYRKLGKMFKAIHDFPVAKTGTLDFTALLKDGSLRGSSLSWREFFEVNLSKHIQECFSLGFLSKKDVKEVRTFIKKLLPLLTNTSLSLLHNDTSARNIFTDGKEIVGIIDWEDAIIGDPLWEIAFIDTFLFSKHNRAKFDAFCAGYGIQKELILSSPLYWMYCLRNSLLKTISRNREGYYNAKGREIDQERISNSLNSLKKVMNNE